jgi:RNA polymerase sigma-70 factor (ECF subfamily)
MSDTTKRWIQGFRDGNPELIEEFWNQYEVRLRRLAERNLGQQIRRRVASDDVVQSAFRTFLRRAHQDEFQLSDRQSLLALLCTITLNKIREKVRYHNRQKRGIDQERYLDAIADLSGSEATPDEIAAFHEVEEMIADFSQEEQQIIHLRLESYTNHEIANQLQCSERTVRRLMNRIRERFKQELGLGLDDN